jgi:hypothetical protein
MSGEERRGSQRRDFARPTEAQVELYQAVKAHQSDLEIQQDAAPSCGLEERIEATRRVLQWLDDHQAFELEPQAPSSSRWNSHSATRQRIRRSAPCNDHGCSVIAPLRIQPWEDCTLSVVDHHFD